MGTQGLVVSTASDVSFLSAAIAGAHDAVSVHEFYEGGSWPSRYVYINDFFCKHSGFSREEIETGSTPTLLGTSSHRKMLLGVLEDVRAGMVREFEAQFFRKDGTPYWADVRCTPLREADGSVKRYLTICRDITERRQADAERRTLYHAIDETADFVVMFDATPPPDGGPFITYVNGAFLHACGYVMHEVLGRPYTDLIAETNDAVSLSNIRWNIEQLQRNDKEIELRRKDGTTFWVEFTSSPVRDSNGDAAHWIAVGRDITERRRTLRHGALLAQAFDALGDAITLYTIEDGELVAFFRNEAAMTSGCEPSLEDLTQAVESRERLELSDGSRIIPLTNINGCVAGLMAVSL